MDRSHLLLSELLGYDWTQAEVSDLELRRYATALANWAGLANRQPHEVRVVVGVPIALPANVWRVP